MILEPPTCIKYEIILNMYLYYISIFISTILAIFLNPCSTCQSQILHGTAIFTYFCDFLRASGKVNLPPRSIWVYIYNYIIYTYIYIEYWSLFTIIINHCKSIQGKALFLCRIHSNDFGFFLEVNAVIQREPVDLLDPELRGNLSAIGIRRSQGWPCEDIEG